MSNNNSYWGKRFGFIHKSGDIAFRTHQMASGRSNSGDHQVGVIPGSARDRQSRMDRQRYQDMLEATGYPFVMVKL